MSEPKSKGALVELGRKMVGAGAMLLLNNHRALASAIAWEQELQILEAAGVVGDDVERATKLAIKRMRESWTPISAAEALRSVSNQIFAGEVPWDVAPQPKPFHE